MHERGIGELPELPAPGGQYAALPPRDTDAGPTSNEPESLLSHIGSATPPNVAAALRLIEDGRRLLNRGRYDEALDRLERSVAIDSTNAYGYFFLARLHYLNKSYDQSVAFAHRATMLMAGRDRIWLGRAYSLQGVVFEEVGRYADARKAYYKAVEADPNNVAARVGVGRLSEPSGAR